MHVVCPVSLLSAFISLLSVWVLYTSIVWLSTLPTLNRADCLITDRPAYPSPPTLSAYRVNRLALKAKTMTSASSCPFSTGNHKVRTSQDWWPQQLDLTALSQSSAFPCPIGQHFDYASAFKRLELTAVIQDLNLLMTTSQDWWRGEWCPALCSAQQLAR